jgi:hypothetical protein
MAKMDRSIMIRLGQKLTSDASSRYKRCTGKEWEEVLKHFNGRCAYCGSKENIVKDHAIPANRQYLGLGMVGNIIPACQACNSGKEKGHKDYYTYCREIGKPEVATKIRKYMMSKGYVPLVPFIKGNAVQKKIEKLIDEANEEVTALIEKHVERIEKIVCKKPTKKSRK